MLDYQLSEPTNGLEFYRSLQKESREVPAILVTGYGDETRIIEAMRAGVRDFIPKTPNFIELVAPTVERVMKQVQAERQLLEAEAASRAKDHFIATLSHELRTPLTPVLALVSALQRDDRLPQDVQEDMATIFRNIELEARLIDDMLDITRIARGKLELQFETVDIRPIIEHAIKTCCAHEAAEKMIVCHEKLADGEHVARVDAARLTQVFWNVLKNAIKFTPGRRPDLRAHAPRRGEGRRLARGRGRGHRHRHSAGRFAARFRRVSAGGPLDHAAIWRARPRAGDQQGDRRGARRHDCRRESGRGSGLDIHHPPPALPLRHRRRRGASLRVRQDRRAPHAPEPVHDAPAPRRGSSGHRARHGPHVAPRGLSSHRGEQHRPGRCRNRSGAQDGGRQRPHAGPCAW